MAKANKDINTNKTPIEGGPGKLKGNTHGQGFTSERQPSPKAKSQGKKKAILQRELGNLIVGGASADKIISKAQSLGIELDKKDLTVITTMFLRMIEKVLAKGDVGAFNALMDRFAGKPSQSMDITTLGEKVSNTAVVLPQGKTMDDIINEVQNSINEAD